MYKNSIDFIPSLHQNLDHFYALKMVSADPRNNLREDTSERVRIQ